MQKCNKLLLIASLICFAIVSCALFVMFFVETAVDTAPTVLSIACGIVFWVFNIIGITLQISVSINVKRWYKKQRLYRTKFKKAKPGVICFFNNVPAIVSDVIWLASCLSFAVCLIVDPASIIAYISISVLFVSFCAHCTFNGNNYYYINNHKRIMNKITKTEEK